MFLPLNDPLPSGWWGQATLESFWQPLCYSFPINMPPTKLPSFSYTNIWLIILSHIFVVRALSIFSHRCRVTARKINSSPSGSWSVETEPSEVMFLWFAGDTIFFSWNPAVFVVSMYYISRHLSPSLLRELLIVFLFAAFFLDLCDKEEGKNLQYKSFLRRKAVTRTSGLFWYCLEGGNQGAWG